MLRSLSRRSPKTINVSLQSNQLEAFTVLPTVTESASSSDSLYASNKINSTEAQNAAIRSTVKDTSRKELLAVARMLSWSGY